MRLPRCEAGWYPGAGAAPGPSDSSWLSAGVILPFPGAQAAGGQAGGQ